MNVNDDWKSILEMTQTSLLPGCLSTSVSEKVVEVSPESKDVRSLNPREVLCDFGRNKKGQYCFLSLVAEKRSLNSLQGIESFPLVERLNLESNALSDVSQLSSLPNLYNLNLSRNRLTAISYAALRPGLIYLNLSHNNLESFPDLSGFLYLRELDLSHNTLSQITSTAVNENLKVLKLSNNPIKNLSFCEQFKNLTTLEIANCNFETLEETDKAPRLETLKAPCNQIAKLTGISKLENLMNLDLGGNRVRDLSEVYNLQSLRFLKSLDLTDNPCQGINFYLYLLLYALPQLLVLDGTAVTTKSKAETDVFFGKDVEKRRAIFERHLPQETFVDYRINKVENVVIHRDLLEEVGESEVEVYNFAL